MNTVQEKIVQTDKPSEKTGIRLMSDGSVEVYSDPLMLETWRFVEGKWQRAD
jgi:hypothetical protein